MALVPIRRTARGKAATEIREAFGLRRFPALFIGQTSKPKRRNTAQSKRFALFATRRIHRRLQTIWTIAVQKDRKGT